MELLESAPVASPAMELLLKEWEDKQGRVEAALDHTIAKVKYESGIY